MTLAEYIQFKNLNNTSFGKMIGVSGNAIGHYISRRRDPARKIRIKIEEATGCQVTITTDNIYLSPPSESPIESTA